MEVEISESGYGISVQPFWKKKNYSLLSWNLSAPDPNVAGLQIYL